MSAPPPVAASNSLVNRVKNILVQPAAEWQVIDSEPATVGSIYAGYIAILAGAAAICSALFLFRLPGAAIRLAVVSFVTALAMPYVVALIIDALATSFGGTRNQVQALKVAAYSSTPSWVANIVAGILALISGGGYGGRSGLGGLVSLLGGIYSLYLLYHGLPKLMKAPADRAMGYTVVTVCATIVVYAVIGVFLYGMLIGTAALGY